MKFKHTNSAKPKIAEILCEPEFTEASCTDNIADINININSDPLALSNNFETQAHKDSRHLAGDLEPEDCDVRVKMEVQEDLTMDSDQVYSLDAVDQVNSAEVTPLSSGEKYFKVSFFSHRNKPFFPPSWRIFFVTRKSRQTTLGILIGEM